MLLALSVRRVSPWLVLAILPVTLAAIDLFLQLGERLGGWNARCGGKSVPGVAGAVFSISYTVRGRVHLGLSYLIIAGVSMKPWITQYKRSALGVSVSVIIGLLAILGVNVLTERATGSTPAVINQATFPMLEAVYVETGSSEGKAFSRTWKLAYTDASHWRKELIDYSPRQRGKFDQLGYFEEANGGTLSSGSPIIPTMTKPNDLPTVPFRWFVPGRLSYLKNAGKAVQVTQSSPGELNVTVGGDETYRLESRYGVPLEVHMDNERFVATSLTFT